MVAKGRGYAEIADFLPSTRARRAAPLLTCRTWVRTVVQRLPLVVSCGRTDGAEAACLLLSSRTRPGTHGISGEASRASEV